MGRWTLREGHGRPEHREPISKLFRFSLPLGPRTRQSLLLTFLLPLGPFIHRIGNTSEVSRRGASSRKGRALSRPGAGPSRHRAPAVRSSR